jgi:hypothetical protein
MLFIRTEVLDAGYPRSLEISDMRAGLLIFSNNSSISRVRCGDIVKELLRIVPRQLCGPASTAGVDAKVAPSAS